MNMNPMPKRLAKKKTERERCPCHLKWIALLIENDIFFIQAIYASLLIRKCRKNLLVIV